MKKTPPVGMGYVDSKMFGAEELRPDIVTWPLPPPEITWKMPKVVTPTKPAVTTAIPEGVKRKLLANVVLGMVPKSEKYEWHIRGEYDLPTMSFRLDLGLSDKHPTKGPPLRIHASMMISEEEELYSNMAFLQTVVDELVKKIVGELARIEKGRKQHDDQTVSRETEWEVSEDSR